MAESMLRAILLDLDDTLLRNDMEQFLPPYFRLLQAKALEEGLGEELLPQLMASTNHVLANTDTTRTNRDVFWEMFAQRTGWPMAETEAFFERFYAEEFPNLRSVTDPMPAAPELVRWCLNRGWRVVVATNPLFPTAAVEQRLDWAGLPVEAYAFDLVTTFDNMHATKPHLAYYNEILEAIDVPAEAALMVGDDWLNDIAPAVAAGCHAYWISRDGAAPPEPGVVSEYGTLARLYRLLQAGWLSGGAPEGA